MQWLRNGYAIVMQSLGQTMTSRCTDKKQVSSKGKGINVKEYKPYELSALDALRAFWAMPDPETLAALPPTEQQAWANLTYVAEVLIKALSGLRPEEVLGLWEEKTKRKKKRGRRIEDERRRAVVYMLFTGKSDETAFNDVVLPTLIKAGNVGLSKTGQPDPVQEVSERENFLRFIERILKNHK